MTWDHKYKSLGELIFSLIESRQTSGPEWMSLCKWFGMEKLEALFEEEKARRAGVTVPNPPNFQEPKSLEW